MRHGIHHFLDFDFLEGTKPTRPRLHVKRTMDSIFFAFVFVFAVHNRFKCLVGDILERLRATNIAGVRVDLQKWFNFRDPRHNSTDSNQSPKR